MASKNSPLSRKDNIVVQELKDEILIYDLKENKAYCLNETSALVWQMCDGNKSVPEISRQLSQKLNSPASEDLVWLAIDQLKKDNLLANSEEINPDFQGLSRREVIRKVGLASMVAIPVVASLVAPTAAHAQSGAAPAVCQACIKKQDGVGACPEACTEFVICNCYDNSGCGSGQFLFTSDCTSCLAGAASRSWECE